MSGDESRAARLIGEAGAAAALSHPNLATIHQIGQQDGDRDPVELNVARLSSGGLNRSPRTSPPGRWST